MNGSVTVRCPICGMVAESLDGKEDSAFFQCKHKLCKYIWRKNASQSVPEDLPPVKDDDDKSSLFGKVFQTLRSPFSAAKRQRNQWENLYLPDPGGNFLDLGNGDPRWLAKAKLRGWIAKHQKDFPSAELAGHFYDAIVLRWILEYHPQPMEVVKEAYRLLMPGGYMIFLLNNVASLGLERYRENWLPLTLPHLQRAFSLNAFRKFLKLCGIHDHFSFLATSVGHHPECGKTSETTESQEAASAESENKQPDFLAGENLVVILNKSAD